MRFNTVIAGLLVPFTAATYAWAAPTSYPLTLENCGAELRVESAPQRAVGIGQNSAEIMLLLGLADRMVGTATWVSPVLPQLAADNERVPRLADRSPSFESVVGTNPDFIAVQFLTAIGPEGGVGSREQFADLDILSYVSPTDCTVTDNTRSDGSRSTLWTFDLLYQEIAELAAIFDVNERGDGLIADFKAREASVREQVAGDASDVSMVFWFSSAEVAGDAWVAGTNGAAGYMMSVLGARNVIETPAEWPLVSWEAIATADPDVIVIGTMDRRSQAADDPAVKMEFLLNDPVASELTAVRAKRIIPLDAQAMNPTIRTIIGLEDVAKALADFGSID